MHGSVSLQLFLVFWIFLGFLGVICYNKWVLSKGHKIYIKDWYLMNSQPNELWPYHQNDVNQTALNHLSFTNVSGLCLNFVDCESFLESNSSDILVLCETILNDLIDFGNFFVTGYLPLIWKNFSTHMHGLAVFVKEGLPFAQNLSLENSADSYLCFWLVLLHSVSYHDHVVVSVSIDFPSNSK